MSCNVLKFGTFLGSGARGMPNFESDELGLYIKNRHDRVTAQRTLKPYCYLLLIPTIHRVFNDSQNK
jgi:hypothetical protein